MAKWGFPIIKRIAERWETVNTQADKDIAESYLNNLSNPLTLINLATGNLERIHSQLDNDSVIWTLARLRRKEKELETWLREFNNIIIDFELLWDKLEEHREKLKNIFEKMGLL